MTKEYKGVSKFIDRHGKLRWRAQAKGKKAAMLPGLYGADAFIKAWAAWRDGKPREIAAERTLPGSIGAFIIGYFPTLKADESLAGSTRAQYRSALERFREQNGDRSLSHLLPRVIADKLDAMAIEPSNMLLRALRRLCAHGVAKTLLKSDPTAGIKKRKPRQPSSGIHTWTVPELQQFEARHPLGTKAHLALSALLFFAARKSDMVNFGRQHEINGGSVLHYRQIKTGEELYLPIVPPMRAAIDATKSKGLFYLETAYGLPFTAAGFGNWFRDRCDEAGLPQCSSHGLRKAAATRLADMGRTPHEIMAVTGHRSLSEVERYTKAANKRRMAMAAADDLAGAKDELPSSKPSTRFAKNAAKSLKRNEVK